jgi:hypothetical protein
MTTAHHERSAITHHERSAIGVMYAGRGLTVAAMIVLYVDHASGNVLVGHIRAGYPSYGQVRIGAAVTTYLIYLFVLGAAGRGAAGGPLLVEKAATRGETLSGAAAVVSGVR